MAEIYAAAGMRFYIGGEMEPAEDLAEADFTDETWVEVDPLEGIGEFGDQAETVTFQALNRGRTMKLKGTRDAGELAVVAGKNDDDLGQQAMNAAEATKANYAMRITYPEGGEDLFVGLVMGKRVTGADGANNVVRRNYAVGINSNIVEVAGA